MSVRITPESPPPEEKFPHGMVPVIPLESFGDGARGPRQIAREKLPLFEGLLPNGLLEAYRTCKRQKGSKGSKKFPDPRLDPDYDSKDPLSFSR